MTEVLYILAGLLAGGLVGWFWASARAKAALAAPLAEAQKARKDGADYLFFGPVFATPSKAALGPPQGPDLLRKVAESVKIPVWAIGGINAGTAAELRGLPIAGVAAISFIATAADPAAAVRALRDALVPSGTG